MIRKRFHCVFANASFEVEADVMEDHAGNRIVAGMEVIIPVTIEGDEENEYLVPIPGRILDHTYVQPERASPTLGEWFRSQIIDRTCPTLDEETE